GLSVSGQIVLDSPGTASVPPGLRVILRPEPVVPGLTTYTGTSTPAGAFSIPTTAPLPPVLPPAGTPLPPPPPTPPPRPAPPPGLYRVIVQPIMMRPTAPDAVAPVIPPALQNVYVKSIRVGDVDVMRDGLRLDHAIDELKIVIGTNPGTIDGHVFNDRKQPV